MGEPKRLGLFPWKEDAVRAALIPLLVVAVCLLSGSIVQAQCPEHQFFDLDDNQVPVGWTQEIEYGGPGVSNGAFRGNVTDGRAWLRQFCTLPENACCIRFEWDGNVGASDWGFLNLVGVRLSSGAEYRVMHGVATIDWGDSSCAKMDRVGLGYFHESCYPLAEGEYHYTVSFCERQIFFKAQRNPGGEILFDLDVSQDGMQIHQVEEIWFHVKTTTGVNAWMDNLEVTVLDDCSAPVEPATWGAIKAMYR